jgi:hypothetical protein
VNGQVGVLHVGYPKGASTFLQKEVFSAERGIVNLSGDLAWERFLNLSVLRMQGQDYAEAAAQAPPLPQVPEGAMLGLSDENILGQGLDCGTVLARLRALFGDAPVLIVIRRQEDLLYSTYVNALRSGLVGGYADFLQYALWDWRNSVAGRVRYGRMHREACRHFSTVRVMVFEELRHDRAAFLAGLSDLLGRPAPDSGRVVNATEGAAGVLGWRMGNRFLRHGYGQPRMTALPDYVVGRGLHEEAGLRQDRTPYRRRRRIGRIVRYLDRVLPRRAGTERADVESAFSDTLDAFYGADNARLSRDLGLDLGRFGYRGCAGAGAGSA